MNRDNGPGLESVERGIEEALAKVPGGGWRSEAEFRAEIDMWLAALGRMVTE
jgi:hypothetical protein